MAVTALQETDNGADSRSTINTNFSGLDTRVTSVENLENISDSTEQTSIEDANIFGILDGTDVKKITWANLTTAINALAKTVAESKYAIFPIWAEENGALDTATNGGYQWSYGNGATTANGDGIVIPFACELFAVSINSDGAGTLITKKNTATAHTLAFTNDQYAELSVPVSYSAGDIVNFLTSAVTTAGTGHRATAWFRKSL